MGMARYFYLYSRFAFQACWLANVCWHWNFLYKINQIFFFKSHDVCCVSALGQNSCIGGIRYKFTTFNSLQKPNLWICLIKVFMALPKFILTLDIIGGILSFIEYFHSFHLDFILKCKIVSSYKALLLTKAFQLMANR